MGEDKYRIYPCRGEYHILDKNTSCLINHLVYPVPKAGAGGLGIHITPTIDGNILLGPSNEYKKRNRTKVLLSLKEGRERYKAEGRCNCSAPLHEEDDGHVCCVNCRGRHFAIN